MKTARDVTTGNCNTDTGTTPAAPSARTSPPATGLVDAHKAVLLAKLRCLGPIAAADSADQPIQPPIEPIHADQPIQPHPADPARSSRSSRSSRSADPADHADPVRSSRSGRSSTDHADQPDPRRSVRRQAGRAVDDGAEAQSGPGLIRARTSRRPRGDARCAASSSRPGPTPDGHGAGHERSDAVTVLLVSMPFGALGAPGARAQPAQGRARRAPASPATSATSASRSPALLGARRATAGSRPSCPTPPSPATGCFTERALRPAPGARPRLHRREVLREHLAARRRDIAAAACACGRWSSPSSTTASPRSTGTATTSSASPRRSSRTSPRWRWRSASRRAHPRTRDRLRRRQLGRRDGRASCTQLRVRRLRLLRRGRRELSRAGRGASRRSRAGAMLAGIRGMVYATRPASRRHRPAGADRATSTRCRCPTSRDYFRALDASGAAPDVAPTLLFETSRGCWWGAKSHCTFCGLNGGSDGVPQQEPRARARRDRRS